MKITVSRIGKEVCLFCKGDFPYHVGNNYVAGSEAQARPFMRHHGKMFFDSDNTNHMCVTYETFKQARESFKETKEAALNYREWLIENKKTKQKKKKDLMSYGIMGI